MKRFILALLLPLAYASISLSHGTCTGHEPAPESHYNRINHPRGDRDRDGIYCENSPRTSASIDSSDTSQSATIQPTAVPLVTTIQTGQVSLDNIQIAPENRCSPYDRDDYYYPQSIELRIISENLDGRITSPYTGETFGSRYETDIEHIVATSEAHDSGLCSASLATRRQFAQDLLNLTLASPHLNRYDKVAKDLAEWLPPQNQCWYVQIVVSVKSKYNLTMDSAEAAVARRLLNECGSDDAAQADGDSAAQETIVVSANPVLWARLLHRSNFRARAGIENRIVGVADSGSMFRHVTTSIDNEAQWWYQVKLPRGWGWIRSYLVELVWQ
ncbi:MAG: DUF1524 domain-containing protein [Chloroflexi bacterium]|nr:DUF1524 domain-containing protein [Chloroflexota bacterium]